MLGISSSKQGMFNFWKLDKRGIYAKCFKTQFIIISLWLILCFIRVWWYSPLKQPNRLLWCDNFRETRFHKCPERILLTRRQYKCCHSDYIDTKCIRIGENKIYNSEVKWKHTSMRPIWSINLANSVSNLDVFEANIIYGFLLRSMQAMENCLARFPMPSIFEISRDSFILNTAIICLILIKRETERKCLLVLCKLEWEQNSDFKSWHLLDLLKLVVEAFKLS